ncbi:MAG: serine/threonine protein kinase [Rhodanobacteraceae bacterium]|nr:serine/threonine protein kinase [Rhodanobacteraceae bacterium]
MTPERWRQVEALFERCAELPEPAREALLNEFAADDAELVGEVRSLLAYDQPADRVQAAIGRAAVEALGSDWHCPGWPVGPYRLIEPIGAGGMGSVWLARRDDQQFDQRVAIKFVASGMGADWEKRFRVERQILARLQHPHIARLLDGGAEDSGRPYLVMEYVDGEPLNTYCDQRQLDLQARLRLFLSVCEAVEYAHTQLVVHRDLKPANILVNAEAGPKLLDFGIAKLILQSGQISPQTRPQQRLMTPDYASPEQLLGQPVSTASDIYSLGVVLFELLCGSRPPSLEGITQSELAQRLMAGTSARPSETLVGAAGEPGSQLAARARARGMRPLLLLRRLRGDLDTIVGKALHLDPQRRYRSAAWLAEDLRRYLDGRPVLARPDGWRYRMGKLLRRHWQGALATTLIVALSVAFVVNVMVQSVRLAAERDRALLAEQRARAVADFLIESFQVADPGQARGETVTVRELLDAGSARIAQELADQPRIQTELMSALGDVYLNLGLYSHAERLHRQAYQRRSATLGDSHPETASSADRLGDTLRTLAQYDESEILLRKALSVRERARPTDLRALADSLNNLGLLLHERGQFAKSEPLLRRAVALRLQVLGSAHELSNVSRVNLALNLRRQGRVEEAKTLLTMVLDHRRRSLGDHYKTAMSAQALATLLTAQGQLDQAEPLLLESLRISRRVLAPQHPQLGNVMAELAYLYHDQLRLIEAEGLYREALENADSAPTPDLRMLAYSTNNYGALLMDLGRLEPAEMLYRRSVALRTQLWGESGSSTLRMRSNLADLWRVSGQPEAAEQSLLEILHTQLQLGEDELAAVADTGHKLALLRADQNRLEEALSDMTLALARLQTSGRTSAGKLALFHADLARLQADSGRAELCAESVRNALTQLGSGQVVPLQAVQVRISQGICEAALGKREQARQTLLAARQQLGPALDNRNRWVALLERRLAAL